MYTYAIITFINKVSGKTEITMKMFQDNKLRLDRRFSARYQAVNEINELQKING